MGLAITAGQISAALDKFLQITARRAWDRDGFTGPLLQVTTDFRAYYEELAVELTDGGPIATWGVSGWF